MQENTQKAIEAYRQALEKYEAAAGRVARLQETRLSAAAEVRKAEQAVEAATAIVQGSVSEADGDPVQALRDLDTARGNLRTAIEQNAYAKAAPSPSPSAGRETDQLRQYRQFACRAIADEELLAMPPEALVILNRAFSVLGGPASVEVWEQLLADTFRFDATTFKDRLAIREEVVAHYGLAGGL
jgi:hypothetical protein